MKIFSPEVLTYLLVSFGFSWAVAAGLYFLPDADPVLRTGVMFLYMCGPAVGALFCIWRFAAGRRAESLGLVMPRWLWLPVAWVIGMLFVVGAGVLTYGLSDITFQDPSIAAMAIAEEAGQPAVPVPAWLLWGSAIFLGPLINIPFMLSEELGWRGWLYDQWKGFGFWKLSVLTGLVWGLWHIPIVAMGHNYPDMPIWGPVIFTGFCILAGPIYTFIRQKTASIWGPCLLHGTMNGAAGVFVMAQSDMDFPWTGLVGIGGFIMLAASVVLLAVFSLDKKAVTSPT